MIRRARGKNLDAIGKNFGLERKPGFLFKESDRKFRARIKKYLLNWNWR